MDVWVTFPQTVDDALADLRALARLFRSQDAFLRVDNLERSIEWLRATAVDSAGARYFCPIWQGERGGDPWWMTFNRGTFSHDLLALAGGENVFAGRERRYPLKADVGQAGPEPAGDRDTRYPRVTASEIRAAGPDVILLPSEPFAFDETHRQAIIDRFPDVGAVRRDRVHLVDGSLVTWHGTRIARALRGLPDLLVVAKSG